MSPGWGDDTPIEEEAVAEEHQQEEEQIVLGQGEAPDGGGTPSD